MKTRVAIPRSRLTGLSCSLLLLGIALIAPNAHAAVNHRPTISWIKDQRITAGDSFVNQSFTIGDDAPGLTLSSVKLASTDTSVPQWYPLSNITITGPPLMVVFANTPTVPGATTIMLTVTDTGVPKKSSATSFTLQVALDTCTLAPVIQGVANQSLAKGSNSGLINLMVKDDDSDDASLSLSASVTSTNPSLLPVGNIEFGGHDWGRTVTITPDSGQTGRAAVTFTLSDDDGNSTSTSCIVDVATGTAPSITLPTHHVRKLGAPISGMTFTISDPETPDPTDLRVTATSSNSTLVPNGGLALSRTTGTRTITVTPTPGGTGAATITLTVSDGDLLRSATYLFVVRNPNAAATLFDRSSGVFVLDGPGDNPYDTSFGRRINLRDENIRPFDFVTGFGLRVNWKDIERGGQPATPDCTPGDPTVACGYDFFPIANLLDNLPAGQVLSLSHTGPEPNNISGAQATTTWVDDGVVRAVPWDPWIRERRKALIEFMAVSRQTIDGVALGAHPRLQVINTYLPGASTGIRDPNFQTQPLSSLPLYERTLLLNTVKDELILWQDNFPGKLVQIGFWPILDTQDADYDGVVAHEWLRQQLAAEFNGTTRPRVGFFQENLAASRPGPSVDPVAGTPLPTGDAAVGGVLYASRDLTWNSFQMLGSWSAPFDDDHVGNTLNGSPNDAIEYGYNTYKSRHAEVYVGDIDNLAMQPALRSWHDYLAKFTAPAGLNAGVISTTQIDVQWEVTGAGNYQLQRQDGPGAAWVQVFAGSTTPFSDTGVTSGGAYAYRVRATVPASSEAPAGGNTSWSAPFPITAVLPTLTFFSEETEDGHVSASGVFETSNAQGIKAGEGAVVVTGDGSDTIKGILSFDTSALDDNAVVTKVTLRLNVRSQNGDPFNLLGLCMVDIKSGTFGLVALEPGDFSAAPSAPNVGTVPDVNLEEWAELTLSGAALVHVNLTGRTQLRIYFTDADLPGNNVTWYAGSSKNPELIVEYRPGS